MVSIGRSKVVGNYIKQNFEQSRERTDWRLEHGSLRETCWKFRSIPFQHWVSCKLMSFLKFLDIRIDTIIWHRDKKLILKYLLISGQKCLFFKFVDFDKDEIRFCIKHTQEDFLQLSDARINNINFDIKKKTFHEKSMWKCPKLKVLKRLLFEQK